MNEIVTENGYTVSSGNNATCYTSFSLDGNITVSTSGSANCGSFWGTTTIDWRLYQNRSGDVTITAANGCTLESVTFTFSVTNGGKLTGPGGSTSQVSSNQEVSLNGTSATFVVGNSGTATNGQVRITKISVNYTSGSTTVDAPTISPNGGNFATSQEVTISHNDADATIYYTLDGSDPTESSTQYTAQFTITTTTTVKAIAVKNGVSSSVTTATFTNIGVGTIADANALDPTSQFIFTGNAVVTYQNGSNLWIRDSSGSGLIYGSGVGTYTNGNILKSGWSATKTVYNGTPEFTNPSGVSLSSQGSTVDPISLNTLTTGDVNKYVILSNLVIASSTTSSNATNYTVDGASYTLRDHFGLVTLTVGKTYNVIGVVSIYNNAPQLYLISAEEVITGDPTLIVNPSTLTINDSGTNNSFTVEATNLEDNDQGNVGVNASSSDFSLTFSSSTNEYATWGFLRDYNREVHGAVAVNYNGRALSANTTVTAATQGDSKSVVVNYVADLYIVTDNGVTDDWHFDGAYGEHMTNNNGVYTATFTAENPNTFILFARKTGEGVTWNTRYVFGPSSGGDWWLPASGNGNGTIDVNTSHPIKIQDAGTYIITINANDGTFTITKEVVIEGDFVLVTDDSQLNTGDEVIIVSSGTAGDTDAKAMSTTQNSNNRGVTTVAVSATQKVTATDDTQIFTLEGDATGWYFKTVNGETQGYIYAASNSSNHLKTEATPDTDNNAKATISVTSEGVATIVFQGTNSRNHLRYNSSNNPPIYSCYASTSTQAKPYLYKHSAGTVVTAPVITPEGGTSNKHFESFNVTITAAEGCTIYYTTDGSTPTISSTPYSVPFLLPYGSEPTTVKAIAVDGQGTVSAVASMTYYWDRVSVTINPASQHVTGDVNVTITATPNDATVTYTINGGAVQTYNGEFIVPVNETNSPVTVEVTATKGESTATTSATYILVDASATLYTKVTSADQIQAGLQYILVHEAGPHALNNFTSSATGGTGVTVAWETQGSVIDIAGTDAIQFTLSGDINSAKFYYGDNIYLGRSGNNGLANNSETEWMILKKDASENDPGGYYLAVGTASNSYRLRYNTSMGGADKFRCYNNNTGDPVYLYVQGAYVTLSDLVQTGVENKKYTISNQLHAVEVTWDNNEGKFAIFAKDNQEYANKSYPTAGQESYLIRYENGNFINEVAQEDYDQSNWIEILIPSDVTQKDPNSLDYQSTLDGLKETFENKILAAGSISGKYVDALNPTIEVTTAPTAESASTYTPNIYCTANFPMYNFENGGAQGNDGIYFMMDPKPHEFCKVVWAYYGGTGNYFIAPAREGDEVNGHDFKGSFLANMSLCEDVNVVYDDVAPYFSNSTDAGLLYGFNAIVRKTEANQANGAPHRIQPSNSETEANPAYVVYPLNASSTSSDNVVDVKELLGGKTIESIHYFNAMGMESKTPFEGINIVVTRYTDGSTSTYKVLK